MAASSKAKVYETASGLKYWMDLKSDGFDLKAPTIRTSDPDVFIVIVPCNSDEETYLFHYNGKMIAFSKRSDQTRRYDNSILNLAARNPELDIVFSGVGQAEVPWSKPVFDKISETYSRERLSLTADTDLGDEAEFEDRAALFFDLLSHMGDGTFGMAIGASKVSRAGFDGQFLKQLKAKCPKNM